MIHGNINVFGHLYSPIQTITSSSGVATIDWKLGNLAKIQLTEDITSLSFVAPLDACVLRLIIIQDSTAWTINWPGSLKFLLDLEPTLPLYANHLLVMDIFYDGLVYYAEVNSEYTSYTISDVVFENLVNGIANGNSFTSTNTNGHCSGTIQLAANGFIEYKLGIYDRLSLGLSNQFENVLTDYDYNFYVGTGYATGIYENNVLKSSPGTAASGGIVRIERVNGNTIKYFYNGVLKYTSLTTTSNPLVLNIWILDNGETMSNVKIAQ